MSMQSAPGAAGRYSQKGGNSPISVNSSAPRDYSVDLSIDKVSDRALGACCRHLAATEPRRMMRLVCSDFSR
jgi:hypothetical protein